MTEQGETLVTPDGRVTKTVLREGKGAPPRAGDTVTVHYVGHAIGKDGARKLFDSTRERGMEFSFVLMREPTVLGLENAVCAMRPGEKAVVRMSPEYGYGHSGGDSSTFHSFGKTIPAGSSLEFELDMMHVARPEQQALRGLFEVATLSAAPPAAAQPSDEEKEIALVPKELREKFESYLSKLKTTIYFKDIEPNTPAWSKRLAKAREKFMRKYGGESAAAPKSSPAAETPFVRDPKRADELKNAGNERLKVGDYDGAVRLYTEAIALRPDCAVYYSNRAAAYQYLNKHQLALEDAQKSVEVDPSFFKGFMRIGHSLVALGRHQQAIDDGFERALQLQPEDQAAKEALSAARAQLQAVGAGGGGGGGGMADLLNNPALRQMAQNMPSEIPPGMEGLMNPEMMRMAMEAMSNPQMQEIMQQPMFQNLARQAAQDPQMLQNMMKGVGKGPAPNQ